MVSNRLFLFVNEIASALSEGKQFLYSLGESSVKFILNIHEGSFVLLSLLPLSAVQHR